MRFKLGWWPISGGTLSQDVAATQMFLESFIGTQEAGTVSGATFWRVSPRTVSGTTFRTVSGATFWRICRARVRGQFLEAIQDLGFKT